MTTADDVRRAMGLTGRSPALTVPCSHCSAQVDEDCHGRTAKTRGKRRKPHPARLLAAPSAVVIAFPAQSPPAA
jgi:hypothetical protein